MKPMTMALIFVSAFFVSHAPAIDDAKKTSIYQHQLTSIDGQKVDFSKYQGQVLVIVNVASECGMTPQYEGLQAMYEKFKDQGFMVIGVPCNQFGQQEPGTDSDIKNFCTKNYKVSFDLFSKTDVNGKQASPLYQFLTAAKTQPAGPGPIGWNFEKFIVNRRGEIVGRFDSSTEPNDAEFVKIIQKALSEK